VLYPAHRAQQLQPMVPMHSRVTNLGLYFLGILHWLFFFDFGKANWHAFDWPKELSYLDIIRQALGRAVVPFHTNVTFQTTDRFLALPETLLSPQVFLRLVVPGGSFIILNTLLLYSVGFVGCLFIRRRYKLSPIAFCSFFLLFNFNGYITSHLSVGHCMWLGYFLLPLFSLYLLELVEGQAAGTIAVKLALLLFFMALQGSFHMVVWCMIFMAMVAVSNPTYARPLVTAMSAGVLLSAFRIAPAALTFYGKGYPFVFISAYPTLFDLCNALAIAHTWSYCPFTVPMGWWEFDAYIGIPGVIFLIFFGLYVRLSTHADSRRYAYKPLDIALIGMLVLSVGFAYSLIAKLPIPFVNSQRYSSRFIIIPLVMLMVISSIRFQKVLESHKKMNGVFRRSIWLLICLTGLLLLRHSFLWRSAMSESVYGAGTKALEVAVVTKTDPAYTITVIASFIVSASTLAFIAVSHALRFLRRTRTPKKSINT
jgi:hypothetical protein